MEWMLRMDDAIYIKVVMFGTLLVLVSPVRISVQFIEAIILGVPTTRSMVDISVWLIGITLRLVRFCDKLNEQSPLLLLRL
jgi:hypothetical protein